MLDDVPQLDEIDAVLDDLSSPDSLEVYELVLPYDDTMLIAAAIQLAINNTGGGGGGGPVDAEDVTVDSATLVGTGTDAQAVFEELDNAIVAASTATSDHIADTSAAHAATAISADSTTLVGTGTTVQAVLEELDDAVAAAQPLDSDLTAIAALTTTAFGRGLLELANQAALLSAAGAAASTHAHAGEDITSGTVADARIASTIARDSEVTSAVSALSSVYQPLDSDLTAIAALTTTSFGRSVLAAADAAALQTLAGTVIGTHVQAFDADLSALAGLTSAANKGIQFTGTGTAATYDLTTAGKALLDDADAAAQLTTLGFTTYTKTLVDDADAATARATLVSAPAAAKYIVQTADSELSAEQALGALATGIVKNTTTTGVLSIAAAGTDYYNPGGTDVAVADGGTGASTAGGALTNLGVSSFVQTILDDADAAAVRTTIGAAGSVATDAIFDAAGDLPVGSGADTAAKLARGTGGQVLAANATTLKFYTPTHGVPPTGGLYENFPRMMNMTGSAGTSGVYRMQAIWLPEGLTVAAINIIAAATAESGGSHAFAALHDSSRNLLRQSTDETGAAAISANAIHTFTLSSAFVTTYTGLHYCGFNVVASGMPTFFQMATNAVTSAIAPVLGGNTSDSGLTATAPNPAAAITGGATMVYCFVT